MAHNYFQVSEVNAAHVVTLRLPESTDSNEFDRLNDEMLEALDAHPAARWVLDVSGLDYMGSSALGLMVNVRQRVIKSKGRLVLCGLSPQLLRIFRTCCLERLFHIAKTRAEALEAVAR